MKQITDVREMQESMLAFKRAGKTIAFVPTMGFLHEGHATLLRAARAAGDILVLSIFVNPTQFGPQEDLDSYPRNLAGDLAVAQSAGVDLVKLIAEKLLTNHEPDRKSIHSITAKCL
jgi:pantoate--beta-alanine ligase